MHYLPPDPIGLSAQYNGVRADGVTDNVAALASVIALATAVGERRILLGNGIIPVGGGLTVTADNIELVGEGRGRTTIKAMDGTSFSLVITGTSRSGLTFRDLTIDVNQANRTATTFLAGVSFPGSTDVTLDNIEVMNHSAGGSGGSFGIAISGGSTRGRVLNCYIHDGISTGGHGSDAVFLAGDDMLVADSLAEDCTDTAFVLEKCNRSRIANCVSNGVPCGGGISATVAGVDFEDNVIDGLTIYDWSAANTGGLQILNNSSGNLKNTLVANVVLHQETPGLLGTALLCRETGAGRIDGLTLSNINVYGAGAHCIGLQGKNISVNGGRLHSPNNLNAGGVCVRVDGASENVYIRNVDMKFGTHGTTGVYALDGAQHVHVEVCHIDGENVSGSYGVFFQGTVVGAEVLWCDIVNCSTGRVGSDVGTTPFVVARSRNGSDGGIQFGKLGDTNIYRNGPDVLKTDDALVVADALTIKTVSGAVTDAAFLHTPPNGTIAVDISNLKIYVRIGGSWRSVTVA